jgi:predicted RNA-binding protein associated with RNAse of E/G family
LNSISFRLAGENAILRGVGKKVLWAFPTTVVQDSSELIVLYMPAGVLGKNVRQKPTPKEYLDEDKINIVDCQWNRTDVLFLIVPGDSFSTYVMWDTGTKNLDCWYVNLQEPIRRTKIGFDTMDHALDVVIHPDMSSWEWKDDDEFQEAQKVGYFSAEKAREIWSEGERAVKLITSERRSMYEKWATWQANPEWGIPKLSPLWDKVNFDGLDLQNKV